MSAGSKRSAYRAGHESGTGERGGEEHPDLRDPSAFEVFYRQQYRKVRAFFVKRRFSQAEADDLAQDVFRRAWERREQYRAEGPAGAWLGQITVSVYKNELRRRGALQREGREVELDEAVQDSDRLPAFANPDRSPEEKAVRAEAREHVREGLTQLPTGMRTCLELHLGGKLTYREIADTLGVAQGTVQSQVHDGKKTLLDLVRSRRRE